MSSNLPDFKSLRVLSLESRMSSAMEKLIQKYGGDPVVAPSLKEVPAGTDDALLRWFEELEAGAWDLVILMTGVGLRYLLKNLEAKIPKDRLVAGFQRTQVVVRGPKPTQVCKVHGIPIAVTVPPPNTWQEILHILSEENLLQGKRVSLVEYGVPDFHFVTELEGRGARVEPLKVYHWALPDDTGPLRQAFEEIAAGKIQILLQTSAIQIDHLLKMARNVTEELEFRRALAAVAIFSIGPTTSAHLKERQIFPDHEVFPNKKENLVETAAQLGPEIFELKSRRAKTSWIRMPPNSISKGEAEQFLANSPFLRACRRQEVSRIPVWLMRQAGRYMAEYQLIRKGMDFLDFCKNADLCTEATLTAVERLGVDAAIIFADILLLVEPMGLPLAFREGLGPVIAEPIRDYKGVEQLKEVDPVSSLGPTLKAIEQVRAQMHPKIPLIGFSGAPFTLASYMIEGKGSRNYLPTKTLMHSEPGLWEQLMDKLVVAIIDYLTAQVHAGCQVLQVFDSWVGCLSPADYQEFVFPHMKRLFSSLPKDVPTIHFGTGTATLLDLQKRAGGDVIGLDWRVNILEAWDHLGDVAVQGNLDPALLFASPEVFLPEVEKLLKAAGSRPGYIFNLGHGILPETPVDHVIELVDFVHDFQP